LLLGFADSALGETQFRMCQEATSPTAPDD
jgi:hypothetical protein